MIFTCGELRLKISTTANMSRICPPFSSPLLLAFRHATSKCLLLFLPDGGFLRRVEDATPYIAVRIIHNCEQSEQYNWRSQYNCRRQYNFAKQNITAKQ